MQQRPFWVRLHEKGGKALAMPCHHTLEAYLHSYVDGTGLASDPKGPLFRTVARGPGQLSTTSLPQANAYAMVRRRAAAAGIATKIDNHTFRATGITAYPKTAERSKTPLTWRTMRRRAQRNATTNIRERSSLKRSSGFLYKSGQIFSVKSTLDFGHSIVQIECLLMAACCLPRPKARPVKPLVG